MTKLNTVTEGRLYHRLAKQQLSSSRGPKGAISDKDQGSIDGAAASSLDLCCKLPGDHHPLPRSYSEHAGWTGEQLLTPRPSRIPEQCGTQQDPLPMIVQLHLSLLPRGLERFRKMCLMTELSGSLIGSGA